MKRFLAPVLALVAFVALAFAPAMVHRGTGDTGGDADEPTSISRYNAVFSVGADGDMEVTETLIVEFPTSDRRGIFRFWDVEDPNEPRAQRVPRDLSVTRDGRAEEFTMLRQQAGRYRVARIGREAHRLPAGQHTYVLQYRIEDVLLETEGGGSRFYWDLVPAGWQQRIGTTDLTVNLPAAAESVRCAVGAGAVSGCSVQGEGSRTLTIRAEGLAPHTPVTVSTRLDLARPEPTSHAPWPVWLTPVLGGSWLLLGLVLVGVVWAASAGFRLARQTWEPRPGFPLQYAPPDGVGPAQGVYLLREHLGREAYVADLMAAAERGAVSLERDGDGWRVAERDPAGWERLDAGTEQAVSALGVRGGGAFTADSSSVEAGKVLQSAITEHGRAVKEWATREGLMTRAGLGSVGGIVAVLGAAGLAVLLVVLPLPMSIVALVPGAFAATGLPMVYRGAGTRRTATGRDLWSRVGGFHRVLSTPSSEARFEFSGREELYTAYLPWAVAFGCADAWAQKYRTEVGTEPPAPSYFGAYAGAHTTTHVDQMVNDFSATVDSAISSYQATQSSSSSGGGGFSGGGGGGGGGGGSW